MDSFFFFIVNQLAAWKTPSFIFSNTRSTTGSRFSLKLNVPPPPAEIFHLGHSIANLSLVGCCASPLHSVYYHVYSIIGPGCKLIRCMTILLSVVCHKCLGLFIIAIWRPHRGNIHIVSCLSGQFSQFRGNQSIVP
mgnify:FL=1